VLECFAVIGYAEAVASGFIAGTAPVAAITPSNLFDWQVTYLHIYPSMSINDCCSGQSRGLVV